MPMRQILERLNLAGNRVVQGACRNAVREVLFEFFNLDEGQFRFTEIDTGIAAGGLCLNPQAAAVEIAQWTDEAREIVREFLSLDRTVALPGRAGTLSASEQVLVGGLAPGMTAAELVRDSPFTTHAGLKLLRQLVDRGAVLLLEKAPGRADQTGEARGRELFPAFKNASRQILTSRTANGRVKGLLLFCRAAFERFFLVSMTPARIVSLACFYRDDRGALRKRRAGDLPLAAGPDPLLPRVLKTGTAYFGSFFDTGIPEMAVPEPFRAQCAVVPCHRQGETSSFLFVASGPDRSGQGSPGPGLSETDPGFGSPFRYLEILSWMMNPETGFADPDTEPGASAAGAPGASAPSQGGREKGAGILADIAATVNELPAMPHVFAGILSALGSPDYDPSELADRIAQDPSTTSTLLKVANSVLYRGVNEISTVKEAVGRLGWRSIRSIVIASATRTLFPQGEVAFDRLGHPLWRHAKDCAVIARRLARELALGDPEEAFAGGILHDIGKLAVLLKDMDAYREVLKLQERDRVPSCRAEEEVLGFTHTRVGALLLRKWNLPESLRLCVENHHAPDPGPGVSPAGVVAVADHYAHALEGSGDAAAYPRSAVVADILERAGVDDRTESRLLAGFREDLEQAGLFD
jgi:putative nucleotidyltransferase with HDIG domain